MPAAVMLLLYRYFPCLAAVATALVGVLLCGAGQAATSTVCKPYTSAITLNFVTKAPAPIYNNNLNVAGIRNLFATRGEPLSGPHRRALGVTYAETELGMQGETTARPVGLGYCIYLTKIDADFGWQRMEVFVAAEYKPGQCEYRAVLDHENQHVAINQAALREYAPRMRATLEAILQNQQPIFVANDQAGADAALNAVYKRIEGPLVEFQKVLGERNSVIDTDSNYDATAQLCPGWNKVPKPQ